MCIPSGCLFDVAIITTPCSNSAVNSLLRIIASAMSVTCKIQDAIKESESKQGVVTNAKQHKVLTSQLNLCFFFQKTKTIFLKKYGSSKKNFQMLALRIFMFLSTVQFLKGPHPYQFARQVQFSFQILITVLMMNYMYLVAEL